MRKQILKQNKLLKKYRDIWNRDTEIFPKVVEFLEKNTEMIKCILYTSYHFGGYGLGYSSFLYGINQFLYENFNSFYDSQKLKENFLLTF